MAEIKATVSAGASPFNNVKGWSHPPRLSCVARHRNMPSLVCTRQRVILRLDEGCDIIHRLTPNDIGQTVSSRIENGVASIARPVIGSRRKAEISKPACRLNNHYAFATALAAGEGTELRCSSERIHVHVFSFFDLPMVGPQRISIADRRNNRKVWSTIADRKVRRGNAKQSIESANSRRNPLYW